MLEENRWPLDVTFGLVNDSRNTMHHQNVAIFSLDLVLLVKEAILVAHLLSGLEGIAVAKCYT